MIQTEQPVNKASIDDAMIPLINIVFLMLIFFMVAGHIEMQHPNAIEPPHSQSQLENSDSAPTLTIDRTGEIWLNETTVTLAQLSATLNKLFAKTDSTEKQVTELKLKVDSELAAEKLQPVLTALKNTNVTTVQLITLQSP